MILAPRNRTLLLEALRPPAGYHLDRAIATTYTLDLLALLSTPLAFTFFDCQDKSGRVTEDPIALLEAVRRYASKIHVFCQAGAIHTPKDGRTLLAYLESCVNEVAAPKDGTFHPKVWVLRFEETKSGRGDGVPVSYRLIVPSRNLTFDRSWDTLLVLNGAPVDRQRAISNNKPLADFLRALPSLARQGVTAGTRSAIEQVTNEVLRVKWELPEGFEDYAFLAFGSSTTRPRWPFGPGRRSLVISPFLDASLLEKFNAGQVGNVLISREESLANIGQESLSGFSECYALAEAAEQEPGSADSSSMESDGSEQKEAPLDGLHAKLFVVDDGWDAHIFTGSANATNAAFERNVEFMVRLTGKKSLFGIEALLGRSVKGGLFELLELWNAPITKVDPDKAAQLALERSVEAARRSIAEANLRLDVTTTAEENQFRLTLNGEWPQLGPGMRVTCWPAVQRQALATEPSPDSPHAVFQTSLEATTAFLSFELIGRSAGLEHRVRFVRRLPCIGLPEDRDARLLQALLKDRETVMRLIYMLLSAEDISVSDFANLARGEGSSLANTSDGLPLLESLLRALDRSNNSLVPVERLLADLSRTEKGRALISDDFMKIWTPILAAQKELAK